MIRSNAAWAQGAKQTGKGVPNLVPTYRTALASDDRLAPRAEMATFAETDDSRDAPNSEKLGGGVEGSLAFGARDSFFHTILQQVLGTKVTTGAASAYVHTITGSDALDYWTISQMLGNTLYETAEDLIANEFNFTVEAGGFATASVSYLGRKIGPVLVEPAAPAGGQASDAVYNFNDAAVSIGGEATALVRSLNLTLSNNVALQQTDDFVPYDAYVGQREVTIGFDMLFDNTDHYKTFHYGSTVGTTQSQDTYVTDLNFLFTKAADRSIEFDFSSVNFEEYPVSQDTGGEPIVVPVRARARRNAEGLLTAVVKNATAV